MTDPKDIAAFAAKRLHALHRATGTDFQVVLIGYALERFLHRLGESNLRDRYVLKGAQLLRVWSSSPYRATRDLDLLRRSDDDVHAIRSDVEAICAVAVTADGVHFDAESIRAESIRTDTAYGGARVSLTAELGKARVPVQIDMGIGDDVWPAPALAELSVLLDDPKPAVLTYPPESVVAEKFEAMVVLGMANSRIKDFFDLHHIASTMAFDRELLVESIRRTFARRGTRPPVQVPVALTREYWQFAQRGVQLRAFRRRALLSDDIDFDDLAMSKLAQFLVPLLDDLRGQRQSGTWAPGGPWSS